MGVFSFLFKARCENVEYIVMPNEADWHAVIKCTNCHENFPKQITFNRIETFEMTKKHGQANFAASCKSCERKCFILIDPKSTYHALPNEDGIVKDIMAIVECRGCEIIRVDIGNSFTVKVTKSPTKYQNVDFSDLWCEVDEETDLLAQVQDPVMEIVLQK